MVALILDSATAFEGASAGISICIKTVIPSLFPFFILSSMLTENLYGSALRILQPIGQLLGISKGTESIWLTGMLGGYPVGARCVAQAYQSGNISRNEAQRMLGFCCNAGPAFIFGMAGPYFPTMLYPCVLFLIQILSSVLTAILIPREAIHHTAPSKTSIVTWHQAMQNALRAIGTVCGWIIAFRVILSVCERWFFWLFPNYIQVILTGITELSNGILSLHRIGPLPLKFILCSSILSFGGMCVVMQTQAVAKGLSIGPYLRGKILQCALSTSLSAVGCCFLFPFDRIYIVITTLCSIFILFMYLVHRKKTVAFSQYLMYNARKKIHAR